MVNLFTPVDHGPILFNLVENEVQNFLQVRNQYSRS